jgi:hypothetical protein
VASFRSSLRLAVEPLDARIVLSAAVPAPPTHLTPGQYPSADAHRAFSPSDLQAYAAAYQTYVGEANFTPQYDFNGTGFIGQNDATPILRGLTSITPRIPLKLTLALAPGEQVVGHHPANSGGVTRLGTVTVVGHTTPNSIIFSDAITSKAGQTAIGFKFAGAALVSNAQGEFEETITLGKLSRGGSLTSTGFLIRTPFGQQTIRAFPILRLA